MLDAFYNQLFRPATSRPVPQLAFPIAALALLVMALNAAGTLNLGPSGLEILLVLFLLGGGGALFWFTAAVTFLASVLGGQGSAKDTFYAMLCGVWPLIFSGAAIAFQRLAPKFGMLLSLALVLGTVWNLSAAPHRTQSLNWPQTLGVLLLSFGLALGAGIGLIVWPLMLILGL